MPGLNLWLAERQKVQPVHCRSDVSTSAGSASGPLAAFQRDWHASERIACNLLHDDSIWRENSASLSYKCKCNHFESFDLNVPRPTVFKVTGSLRKQYKAVKVVCIKFHIIKFSLDFLVYKCGALAGINVCSFLLLHVFIYLIWEACNAGDKSGSIISFM